MIGLAQDLNRLSGVRVQGLASVPSTTDGMDAINSLVAGARQAQATFDAAARAARGAPTCRRRAEPRPDEPGASRRRRAIRMSTSPTSSSR